MANTQILVEGGSYVFAFVLARLLIRTRKSPSYRMSMVYVERIQPALRNLEASVSIWP